MNEPFKTTERFVIQRRFPKAKMMTPREWHSFEYQPDGRVSLFEYATFKTLAEAKKVRAKLIKQRTDVEYRIVNEVHIYTIVED
jgi:hypothetical protein